MLSRLSRLSAPQSDQAKLEAAVRKKREAERKANAPTLSWRESVRMRTLRRIGELYHAASLPFAIVFLLSSQKVHTKYQLTWRTKFALGFRMWRNTKRITTGTSYKAHLVMAAKLFEISPKVKGAVVECGCWKGGSTANLSLICDIVGRDLIVYDTFEGLPTALPNDKYASAQLEGFFRGDLEVVQDNVRRFGAIDRCTFRKGLFSDTLPGHAEPIVLCFLDVDYQSSLHDCVVNLWPHLTDHGYMFIDEYTRIDYCALFFSESWWTRHFDRPPPGMMGVGTGVGVGDYFVGPHGRQPWLQAPTSIAYTRKDFHGRWDYEPDALTDDAPA
jgi:O-methyltransferase